MQGKQTVAASIGYVSPSQNYKSDDEAGKTKSMNIYLALVAVLVIMAVVAALFFTGVLDSVIKSSEASIITSAPTLSPTSAPTSANTQNLFPIETREGDDYIGLYLLSTLPDEAFQAFKSAATRWSAIVEGTVASAALIEARKETCGLLFEEETLIDHLIISVEVTPFGAGLGGTFVQAGPCARVDLPLLGIIKLNSDQISLLIENALLETVILHQMGHVLGIGSLWRDFDLLQDPILNQDGSLNNASNQPKLTGDNVVGEYRILTGNSADQFVPVEDGTIGGVDFIVPKTNAANVVDIHWDLDFLPGELMAFSLDISGPVPPLSATSIASLADLGYVVDVSLADAYSVATGRAQRLRGDAAKAYPMVNDVLKLKPVILKPAF